MKNCTTTVSFLHRGQGCTTEQLDLPGRRTAPVHPQPPRLFQRHRSGRRSILRDERAHVFLLVGLLLAMGTVTMGGIVVTMNAHEESIQRDARQNLMDPVKRLLSGFNESVREAIPLGETNITTFQERVGELEKRVHAQAARDGIYMTIAPHDGSDPSLWQSPGRCPSYDISSSRDGVVIGYDEATNVETITGALFSMQATDGEQLVRFPYYVKLFDCLPTSMTTWFSGIRVVDGWVQNPEYAKSANDNNAVMTLGELPIGSVVVSHNMTMDEDEFAQNGWENERYVLWDDTRHSHHPATPLSDYFIMKADTSDTPPDAALYDVRIRFDSWHVDVQDDYLQLRVLHNGTVMHTWAVPTTTDEQTFRYDVPLSPSGNPTWTAEELAEIEIEFQVIEVDKFDPNAFFMVEYVDVEYNFTAPEKYAFVATIDWPVIPDLYDRNIIGLRYSYTNSTPGEAFELQVHSNGTWQTRIVMNSTDGGWRTVEYQLLPEEMESGILEMRIVDSIDTDQYSSDADKIYIDYLRLWSEVDP